MPEAQESFFHLYSLDAGSIVDVLFNETILTLLVLDTSNKCNTLPLMKTVLFSSTLLTFKTPSPTYRKLPSPSQYLIIVSNSCPMCL